MYAKRFAATLSLASVPGMLMHLRPHCCYLLSILLLVSSQAWAEDETKLNSTSDEISIECQKIGKKLGSVSINGCMDRNLSDTGARSVQGQPILFKEYPPLDRREPLGRVLLIGGTHGDEYSSVSIVFKWMQTLDTYHSGMFHWHVVPLLNPDGLLLNNPSVRLNAHGIDLNRNMPTPDWRRKTGEYWAKTGHDPRRYPGSAPLSEPESQWLYDEIRDFKPHAIVSVHAPYGVLDFDGPPVGPERLGYLHLKLIGTYPGSLGNCAGVQHEIPVITVELPYAGIMPSQAQVAEMWQDLVRWLRMNIPKQKTIAAYQHFDQTSAKLLAQANMPDAETTTPASDHPQVKSALNNSADKHPVTTQAGSVVHENSEVVD